MKIQSNGVNIRVREAGHGETALVFLHYWGGSSRTWRHVTTTLSNQFRTIATDHRGWGDSDAGEGNYDINTLALDAQGVIDTLDLKRYVIVGHSMGGKVAQLMASRQPQGLVGAVLVAPGSPAPATIPAEQREFISHAYDSRESVLGSVGNVLTAKTLSKDDLEQVVEDSLRGAPGAKLAWPLNTMMEDISAVTVKIKVPVLILAGELDKVDSVDQLKTEVLARIPGATMQTVPGTGHLSPLESPAVLAEAITEFMDGL
ncbi:alpha/beta hydrolase [Dyella monticola]|uniref:Alpha/beta hydrolase n=1 Tax=Dyella monticola TaxID=1927958 RepID=A0A370X5D2_9GAMM|nr:alpha/beta hydrolase [Dyella monticola]RDS83542.1 alpha/beta hydrolase [Dyella monticola]